MKSTRTIQLQYKNGDRKSKNQEKGSKLDRKSSRGMIFENEELRLRTININAEVERGQTDIKRLRRENEHLRREIWTLRDECDRLNKKFKAKILDHEHGNCNVRGSGGGSSNRTRCPSQSDSDDTDSCDTCKGYDGHCSDDCCQISTTVKQQNADVNGAKSNNSSMDAVYPKLSEPQHLHNTFDHLSVVSEETLSNNDVHSGAKLHQQQQQQAGIAHTANLNGSQTTLPGLFVQLTPLTPIELVTNQLNDLQATVPPLSYFENIVQQHMGSTIGTSPETANISPNSKIVKHTNGWDYNIQSPFAQRKPPQSSEPPLPLLPPSLSSALKQRRGTAPPATLTTFASASCPAPQQIFCADVNNKHAASSSSSPLSNQRTDESTISNVHVTSPSKIETIAITTMPTTAPPPSPKHFFSPLKPRLKINTALANKNASIPTPPIVPTTALETTTASTITTAAAAASTTVAKSKEHQNCDPPDIFVTNALASPYKRPSLPYQLSPQLPQRNTNSSSSTHVESVNLETILNDIEHISEDILAIQLEKIKPRGIRNDNTNDTHNEGRLKGEDKTKKPYRSEMNLQLSYDGGGPNPTITPASVNSSSHSSSDSTTMRSRARSLERNTTESPSPKIPDAMPAFPDSRTYIGFEKPSPQNPQKLSMGNGSKSATSSPKKLPPTPPIRLYPSQSSIHNARSYSLASGSITPPQTTTTTATGFTPHGLVPNKSHLYKALANATAKRGQFRLNSPVLSKSLDTELASMENDPKADAPMSSSIDKALNNAEALNRNMRHVSILCGDSPDTPDGNPTSQPIVTTPVYQLSTASCTNLTATPTNPLLQSLKQITCQSTPNSPHSVRRRNDVNAAFTPSYEESLLHTNLAQHQRNSSNNGSQFRRSSQDDSLRGNGSAQETMTASINPTATRSKCSRRHSDGTVVNNGQRASGVSGHHHHHHHHHQHSSSTIVGGNGRPHHSHISHQDNQETGSVSDRNSTSFASSRDSSTSFSLRSQRRKISVSSHTGGKIPWCGCWGNGCL